MSRMDFTGGLSRLALESQAVLELPQRTVLSLINANLAVPVNAAIAANVLSDGSNAGALARQDTPIMQALMMPNPVTEPATETPAATTP